MPNIVGASDDNQQVAKTFDSEPYFARLVLGWVTVCGRANHLGMYNQATQTNSARPSVRV